MDNSGERRSADRVGQQPFPSVRPGHSITRIVSRTEELARTRPCPSPTRPRSSGGRSRTATEATDNSDAGAVRRDARLAGQGWLGQGFQQGPDLGVGVASVAAQGAEVGQHALLGPAADRLWGHLEELGDLGCAQVPGLGWLEQCALPFLLSPPGWDDPMPVGAGCHRVFYTGWLSCDASRCGLASGRWHAWTLTSPPLLALELREPPTAGAPTQATGMHRHRLAARHARTPGCDTQ